MPPPLLREFIWPRYCSKIANALFMYTWLAVGNNNHRSITTGKAGNVNPSADWRKYASSLAIKIKSRHRSLSAFLSS
jgi:hypothetical protein